MGGGEMFIVGDTHSDKAYVHEKQERNSGEGNNSKDTDAEERQDREQREEDNDYSFQNHQTENRDEVGGETSGGRKEKDKKRKKDEKERNKGKEVEKDKGKKYKGFTDVKEEKKEKDKKNKKLYDIHRHTYGKEDEGKYMKGKKGEEKKKDQGKKNKDNQIAEKLKKKLTKLDYKLEKILAKKEYCLQKLKEIEGMPVEDFNPIINCDSEIVSKLDTGSLEIEMLLLNVSDEMDEEKIGTDRNNKGEAIIDEMKRAVYTRGKSCRSGEMEARERMHEEEQKRKGKKEKKVNCRTEKLTEKLAELYAKLGHVLYETEDYLQGLKELKGSSQHDSDAQPERQPLSEYKRHDKDMESLGNNTLGNSQLTENGKYEFSDSGNGFTAQDGRITYPILEEKDFHGVDY